MVRRTHAVVKHTLRDLSGDVLSMIMDYVDSVALVRTFLIGDTNLNDKLLASVTRFKHTVACSRRHVFWPKIVSRFRALTHVSVLGDYGEDRSRCVVVHEVDIMSLPSTLQSLELDFDNAFLSLIDLPPADSDLEYFSPRLRSGLKDKFSHLVRLTWSPNFEKLARESGWDLYWFICDLSTDWTLVLDPWPEDFLPFTLDDAEMMPTTTLSLRVTLAEYDLGKPLNMPSLMRLEALRTPDYGAENLFEILPPSLTQLIMFRCADMELLSTSDLAPLSLLNHLTELQFHPLVFDTALAQALPRSLTKLDMEPEEGEFEAFAHLPAGLLILDFHCHFRIYSSTTGESLDTMAVELSGNPYSIFEVEGEGAPDDFMPASMMRDVVARLPRQLKRLPAMIFIVVRPKDWDVLPREALHALAFRSSFVPVFIDPEQHGLYLANLPPFISAVAIQDDCTVPLVQSLSRFIRTLQLNSLGVRWKEIFAALSQSTPILKILTLGIDEKFEWDHLSALTMPLEEFSIISDWSTDALNSEWQERLGRWSRSKLEEPVRVPVPHCLHSLRKLTFGNSTTYLSNAPLVSIFEACSDLRELIICETVPAKWTRFLPRKLVSFDGPLEPLNVEVFRNLPKSLLTFIARQEDPSPEWRWQDLYQLPPLLRFISLPAPKDSDLGHAARKAILDNVAKRFHHDDVVFDIRHTITYTYKTKIALISLLVSEWDDRRVQDAKLAEQQEEERQRIAKRKRS